MPIKFGANAVLLISSLPMQDAGIARRCAEDIATLSRQLNSLPVEHREIASFNDLLILLTEVERRFTKDGYKPIVHFDMHGSKSGLIFCDHSEATWPALIERLTRLNGHIRMNLVISLGVCEGAWAIMGMKGLKRSPFALLLAPRTKISAGQSEKWTKGLFESIFRNKELVHGLQQGNEGIEFSSRFRPYPAEELFLSVINHYASTYCHRAARRARVSRIRRGLRRTGTQIDRAALDDALEKTRFTEENAISAWNSFAWQDLGADVAERTPFRSKPGQFRSIRLKNGKSVSRLIRKARVGDHMYGRIGEYANDVATNRFGDTEMFPGF